MAEFFRGDVEQEILAACIDFGEPLEEVVETTVRLLS
jgi:hypothetical protein